MKTISKILFAFAIFLLMAFSCKEDEEKMDSQKQNVSGLVLYFGDPAVNGCGWLIEIDSVIYSPILLDSMFKKDSLKIILDCDILKTTWNCGWREPGYPNIEIKKIKIQ